LEGRLSFDKNKLESVPKTEHLRAFSKRNESVPKTEQSVPKTEQSVPKTEQSVPKTEHPLINKKENLKETLKETLERKETYPEAFVLFWKAYPRKTGKDTALKAWEKRKPPLAACLTALAWQTKQPQWTKDGGQFIPMPATWLTGGRWNDEPSRASVGNGADPIPGKYAHLGEK